MNERLRKGESPAGVTSNVRGKSLNRYVTIRISLHAHDREITSQKEHEAKSMALKELDIENEKKKASERKLRLQEWKISIESKELQKEPISVPTEVDHEMLRMRHERDLESAKSRSLKIGAVNDLLNGRNERMKEAARPLSVTARKDFNRLVATTKAHEGAKTLFHDIECADSRRKLSTAHSRPIPLTGTDLKTGGRAKASWLAPPRPPHP